MHVISNHSTKNRNGGVVTAQRRESNNSLRQLIQSRKATYIPNRWLNCV